MAAAPVARAAIAIAAVPVQIVQQAALKPFQSYFQKAFHEKLINVLSMVVTKCMERAHI